MPNKCTFSFRRLLNFKITAYLLALSIWFSTLQSAAGDTMLEIEPPPFHVIRSDRKHMFTLLVRNVSKEIVEVTNISTSCACVAFVKNMWRGQSVHIAQNKNNPFMVGSTSRPVPGIVAFSTSGPHVIKCADPLAPAGIFF